MKRKPCFKCGETKPLSAFYKHFAMTDGHLGKCKECTKKDVTQNRDNNLERIREYDRNRGSRQTNEYLKAYRKKNPDRYRAHSMVNYHVRAGNLTRKPCEICGTDKRIEAHHDDYSRPLDVRWLCSKHHKQHHNNRNID